MRMHRLRGSDVAVDCPAARCRICELTDPAHPDFDARFHGLYEPSVPGPRAKAIAARHLTILACDYRLDAVGLERGSGCGCTPATRCLLGRGKWPDDPGVVDYGDCLACTGGG